MRDEMAGVGRRVGAVLIDFVMLELAMWPLGLAIRELTPSPAALRLLQFTIAVMYSSVFLGERGQTPGKIMVALRVISADGGAMNPRQAFVRSLAKWGAVFTPLIAISAMVTLPTNVQNIGTQAPLVPMEVPDLVPIIGFLAFCLWFVLIVVTRRHENGQAPHDRLTATTVMRIP
jgi:uncharacterized RDD family membrane protein YckC